MICCDYCKEWYHFKCINLKEENSKKIKRFKCDVCKEKARVKKEKQKMLEEQIRVQQEIARIQASKNILSSIFQNNKINQFFIKLVQKPTRFKCSLKGCKNLARVNSKYCKDACGIEATRMVLRNIELLNRIRQSESRRKEAEDFGKQVVKLLQDHTHKQHYLLKKHKIKSLKAQELIDVEPLPFTLPDHQIELCISEMEEIKSMYEFIDQYDSKIEELEQRRIQLDEFIGNINKLSAEDHERVGKLITRNM